MEGVIVPPPEVREKKAALVEVIELQRLFIAQRGSEGAVGDGGDDDEEMRWYTEQAARLEKFKAALNAVRLQPDEFPILVPQRWAVRALKQLHALKGTTYDPRDPTHESLLARLWVCGFGADPPWKARSERWVHLGFQSDDPTRDFRAMGVLGLANLVYFGEHYPDVFQRLVGAQRRRDYPLACAGINITSLLVDLLNMRDEGGPASVQSRPPFDAGWSSDGFHFFCHMFYRDRAFEDMYCFCLRLLDRMYVSMDADYADFNTVLAALRSRLVDALAQRPLSFREFKRLIAAGGADSEGSATSCGNAAATTANAGSSASSADAAGEEGEHEQLAHTIAEVMATLPRHLEGMKVGLKGAAAALLSKSSLLSPPSAAAATTGKATTSTTGNGDADGGGGDGGDAAASVEDPPCAGSHST